MLTAKQNEYLLKAVDLLHEADVLMQKGFGRDEDSAEECYCIHNAIECAAEDILEYIQEKNEDIEVE